MLFRSMVRMFGCDRSKNAHIERKKSKMTFLVDHKPVSYTHLAEAVKKGEALEGIVLTIAAKVSATGQLYGSVNAATVAEEHDWTTINLGIQFYDTALAKQDFNFLFHIFIL